MISYKIALSKLSKSKIKIGNEKIYSFKSLNRVCAINVYSPANYPTSNNTAFDGYAVNSKETKGLNFKKFKKFEILKTLAAGDNPKIKKIKKYQTIEVTTGALINKPFDTVIPIENIIFHPSEKNKKYILINKKIKKNQYIRYCGSDFKKKELIISKGKIIEPSHILAFKSLGIEKILVKKKPNVLFFSTGNEITEKKIIEDWKVRNSNSYYIKSLSNNFLINYKDGGILRDKDSKIFEKILKKNFLTKIDIIITCGAVSAGKFDFVPSVLKKFKLSNFFKDVAIRPGKPVMFSKFKNKEKAFFGLPGNPISTAACFRFFIYPYISNILGIKKEKYFKARLKNNFKKKKNFTRFLKAKLTSTLDGKLEIEVLKGQESFRIKSFIKSNVWAVFRSGQSTFRKGQLIECHLAAGPNKDLL